MDPATFVRTANVVDRAGRKRIRARARRERERRGENRGIEEGRERDREKGRERKRIAGTAGKGGLLS